MRTLITGAALFCVALLQAQVEYVKGYFIYNAGKKVECLIEDLDWKDNPGSFRYKINPADKPETENLAGVQEFALDGGRRYKRYMVEIERSLPQTNAIQNGRNPNFRIETLFLLELVSGPASLYEYSDGNVHKFFYETKDKPIEQLVMIRYMDGNSTIGENKMFQQQLYNHVRCDKTPDASFKTLDYAQRALIAHFERYNGCFENAATSVIAQKKYETFALRVVPGVQFGTMELSDPYSYYDASVSISQLSYRIGVELEVFLPFNHSNWSVFFHPSYQNFDASKNYVTYVSNPGLFNDGDLLQYTAFAKYATVDLPLGVRRHFRINSTSRLFVDAAYVFPIVLSSDDIKLQNNNGLTNATVTLPVENKANFAVGLGFGYKKWTVEARYNTARILTDAASWNTKFSSYGLLLGYKLF